MKASVQFELLTWWHAGSGRGDGERADAVVQVSSAGLPYLPGRTVKGLLRAAAATVGASEQDLAAWFGTALLGTGERVKALEEARFLTKAGSLTFSSATLGPAWEAYAKSLPSRGALRPLFALLATTAVDHDTGTARDRSLRTVEVAAPMILSATVEGPEGERWFPALQTAAPFLRSLGSGRNRGLGRVRVTVEEVR